MSAASSLLSLVLAAGPSPSSLPAVHDARGHAWALVHAGRVWACWSPGPDCFVPLELERPDPLASPPSFDDATGESFEHAPRSSAADAGSWRLGFGPGGELWLASEAELWRVEPGQRLARASELPAPVALQRPRRPSCSPIARVPLAHARALGWVAAAPCPSPRDTARCPARRRPALRKPTPLHLRAGLELRSWHSWRSRQDAAASGGPSRVDTGAGLELSFVIELGLAPARARSHARARARLQRADPLRTLPGPRSESPFPRLHEQQRRALASILCAGSPS